MSRLYALIFSGEIAAGDLLGELELTKQLGVSRTPVREALIQLERDGIINVSPVSGRRVVAAFGPGDIREIYTIRAALEAVAFAEAATRMTPESATSLADLQAELDVAELSAPDGRERQFDADFHVHELVCQTAELPRLHRELPGRWRQTRLLRHQLAAHGIDPRDDELTVFCSSGTESYAKGGGS